MIPATNTKVLVTEDWKKIYQSFKNIDFKSYDFETLKRTMISYLQENFPEDFNDYIDSSEYIALIDIIAFLGQNLSFRIDLNARENFLETAQRRDSILRLAQLISYNPARNIPSSGFLKITAISTTDSVIDSNGTNLANTTIAWNDATNPDWYQQFINILNSTMGTTFGRPVDKKVIDGISTEQYRINTSNEDVPIFTFSKPINGTQMSFEITPCTFSDKEFVYESPPQPGSALTFIYKNDNQGSSSINSGFFMHFRQGTLSVSNFSLDNPVPNEIVAVNAPNINNTDVWLWQLDQDNNFSTLWTPVESIAGSSNNVIYNSLNKNLRKIYAVTTRDTDQIDLNFSDGVFGDLPKGRFSVFYRQSNALTYSIKPDQLSGILILVPYRNALGQDHTLQITLSLQYTVTNSSGPESDQSIKTKAPQVYYTQNRMITGEDYNIAPLAAGPDILKLKAINRVSSGISKYFDINDVSGSYSSTNLFGLDGIIYQDEAEQFFEFEPTNRNQIFSVIKNQLAPVIASPEVRSFYVDKYTRFSLTSITWTEVNKTPNQSRGYISSSSGPLSVGEFTATTLKYIKPNALLRFDAPTGTYFDSKNYLRIIPSTGLVPLGGKRVIWTTVIQVVGDGSGSGAGVLTDGTGPIILSARVPSTALLTRVLPGYVNSLSSDLETEIATICLGQQNFGLTINNTSRTWDIIIGSNLNLLGSFSLSNQENFADEGADASWIVAFVWDGKKYRVRYRSLYHIFESEKETSFFVDNSSINFDFKTNTVLKDKITILSINTNPLSSSPLGVDYNWQIDGPIVEEDGYIDPKKVKISFYDFNNSNNITEPDSFYIIVNSLSLSFVTGFRDKFVYFKKSSDGLRYNLVDEEITAYPNELAFSIANQDKSLIANNTLYYFYDPEINVVKYWSTTTGSLVYTDEYIGKTGRSNLKFQYQHNTGRENRIDPSKSNIIDLYVLTLSYDTEFRSWLLGNTASEPLAPTSQSLEQNYGEKLENIKAISDEIIFNPVKYKVLFGAKAPASLQATFKAVKNSQRPVSDSNIRARILTAINEFFALENWEFGQSFYFSELSAYVMNKLTPDITNFVIVPKYETSFGSFYEIACQSNEIFISGATADNIEIIETVTSNQLKSLGITENNGS